MLTLANYVLQCAMAKSSPVGIRLEPAQMEALQRAAAADDRSVAWVLRKIVNDWLAASAAKP